MRWRARVVAWVAVVIAVLLQGALLTRLNIPLAITPVLVIVMAMRMTRTEAALVGFFAGLLLDITPPAEVLLGGRALVLCCAAYLAAANQYLVPQMWWVRALFASGLATIAVAAILALDVLTGTSMVLGWAAAAYVLWQFVLGSIAAALLWPVAVSTMGPPPRRPMGVAP